MLQERTLHGLIVRRPLPPAHHDAVIASAQPADSQMHQNEETDKGPSLGGVLDGACAQPGDV